MASGVTYQALERLTNMPERSGEQGDRIAGQFYYDVNFTGGAASNLTLTNATINGINYNASLKVKTSSYVLLTTDNIIVFKNSGSSGITATLPATPAVNQFVVIKDGNGTANTFNITISGNGNTIDGGSSLVIGSPRGWNQLVWDGLEWNIIS